LTWTSPCEDWSLTSLKEKLIKIGAKVVSHGRYVAIPRQMFQEISRLIAELRPQFVFDGESSLHRLYRNRRASALPNRTARHLVGVPTSHPMGIGTGTTLWPQVRVAAGLAIKN
jgi:hypothetical protein